MTEIKVICKNHGIVQRIERDAMWVGPMPLPHTHCPYCGEKTIVEYPPSSQISCWRSPTEEEKQKAKEAEIEFYRKKYWEQK